MNPIPYEQVLKELKEIKELLQRFDPTSTQPGPWRPNPYYPCPCTPCNPYWDINPPVTCGPMAVWNISYGVNT